MTKHQPGELHVELISAWLTSFCVGSPLRLRQPCRLYY